MPNGKFDTIPHVVVTFHLSLEEIQLVEAIFQWKGVPITQYPTTTLPKLDFTQERILWQNPTIELLEFLEEEGWFVVGIGSPNQNLQKELLLKGLACLWTDLKNLNLLPIHFPNSSPQSLMACIYTGIPWLDRIFTSIWKALGQKTIPACEVSHILPLVTNHKPDLLIVHWQNIEKVKPNWLQELAFFSQRHTLPPIIGLMDYTKENISSQLLRYIGQFTKMNLTPYQFLSGIIYNIPKNSFSVTQTPSGSVRRLNFVFPERNRLQSIEWDWVSSPPQPLTHLNSFYFWKWFQWLLDEDIWNQLTP